MAPSPPTSSVPSKLKKKKRKRGGHDMAGRIMTDLIIYLNLFSLLYVPVESKPSRCSIKHLEEYTARNYAEFQVPMTGGRIL